MSADSSGDLKFNFGIPVGQRGEKGDVGDGVNYLGEIDATTAPAPSDPVNGDFYVNTVEGLAAGLDWALSMSTKADLQQQYRAVGSVRPA